MSDCDPYVYIHILPEKTGDPYEREIVPISSLRKFDYVQYKQNPNSYKDQYCKFKSSSEGKKLKCFILYAADSHHEVQQYIDQAKAKNQRFRIPKSKNFYESISTNDSTIESQINEHPPVDPLDDEEYEMNNAKAKRKAMKQLQKENQHNKAQSLVNDYINAKALRNQQMENQVDEDYTSSSETSVRNIQKTSTPMSDRTNLNIDSSDREKIVRAYKMQIQYYKDEAVHWKTKYERLESQRLENYSELQQLRKGTTDEDNYSFSEYDRIYNVQITKANREKSVDVEDGSLVQLRRHVKCNSLAYKHAYASAKPSDFISLISKGIYGIEDLANRCVKKQKNTANQVLLDPIKTEIIEEEFYNYLRVKRYTFKQVEKQLEQLNRYHHNSISIARKQVRKVLTEESQIQQVTQEFEAQCNELHNLNNLAATQNNTGGNPVT